MLAPIAYKGPMPVRNDFRGDGEFGTKRRGNRSHQGIDILARIGTPVRAAKGGVAYACLQKKGMGKYVRIQHRAGLVTIYGHLSKICIKPVQRIRQGQVIGAVGDTGNAQYRGIQPHLHFEIRRHGVAVDPKKHLS